MSKADDEIAQMAILGFLIEVFNVCGCGAGDYGGLL